MSQVEQYAQEARVHSKPWSECHPAQPMRIGHQGRALSGAVTRQSQVCHAVGGQYTGEHYGNAAHIDDYHECYDNRKPQAQPTFDMPRVKRKVISKTK